MIDHFLFRAFLPLDRSRYLSGQSTAGVHGAAGRIEDALNLAFLWPGPPPIEMPKAHNNAE
jgi:hypothetical protein